MSAADRGFVAAGGLAGCLGVGLAAAAAHVTGPGSLDIAARFFMIHAPAFLVIPVLARTEVVRPGLLRAAGFVLVLGLLLFCGDLALRSLAGLSVLPMAAPVGGTLLIGGWAIAGASGPVAATLLTAKLARFAPDAYSNVSRPARFPARSIPPRARSPAVAIPIRSGVRRDAVQEFSS